MKITLIRSSFFVAGVLLCATGCSHKNRDAAPETSAVATSRSSSNAQGAHAEEDHAAVHAKTYAPVDLELSTSATHGVVELGLLVRPTTDVPNALARFVLPEGVTLVGGSLETPLGALAKGSETRLSVRVSIPAEGHFNLAAGLVVKYSPGRQLARSVVLGVGDKAAKAKPRTRIITLPEGGTVRVAE